MFYKIYLIHKQFIQGGIGTNLYGKYGTAHLIMLISGSSFFAIP